MAKKRKITRRQFLHTSMITAAGLAAAACAGPMPTPMPEEEAPPAEEEEPAEEEPAAPGVSGNQSPMLQEMVEAGELPPLEERLPQDMLVVGPGTLIPQDQVNFQVGKYGGTMRYCTARTDVCAELYDANAEPPLMAIGTLRARSIEGDIKPNLFASYEVSDDQQIITFHMRRGLKWSDGEPCTTEDVRFWYEDVLLNEEITPIPGKIFKTGNKADGELMDLNIVDDYTFTVSFAEPGLAMVEWLSRYGSHWDFMMRPAHYMKQFHVDYADADELKALLEEENLPEEEWWRYFQQRDEGTKHWVNVQSVDPDYPRLSPWKLKSRSPGVVTWDRNPYYWKVDIDGNQLPYIDELRIEIVSDSESVTLKIVGGEVDWAREYASMANYPLYKENEDKAGLNINILDMHVAPLQLAFNFTHPDEVWREVVRDVRFRKAMNMAIDHQNIVEVVYKGFGEPPTAITGLSYDPEGAEALLDEMGMDQRDDEGWRLGPDGKRFVFPLEVRKGYTPSQDAVCELLVEYWQDIGIKTEFKNVEATLYNTRADNNDLFVDMHWAHTSFWRSSPTNNDYLPFEAELWDDWHATQGAEGEEPEEWAKRLWEIADTADSYVMSPSDVEALHEEMWQILEEQVPMILPIDHAVYPLLGSKKLGNVPTSGYAILASFTQEEFFFNE